MKIKLNEIYRVKDNKYALAFSIIVDLRKIDVSTFRGKELYAMLHECLSTLHKVKFVNHENLLTREVYQKNLWHSKLKPNVWIKSFKDYLAEDTSSYDHEIFIARTFNPEAQ